MKAIKQTLLALALASAFTTANATPVDWTLNNVTLATETNGVIFTFNFYGSFTYDADTNTYSNLIIARADVGTALYNSAITTLTTGDANGIVFLFVDRFTGKYGTDSSLTFADALSNAGGVITLSGGNYSYYGLTGGAITGVPQATASAVPEPEVYAMMLAGLGLVGFAARRKLS